MFEFLACLDNGPESQFRGGDTTEPTFYRDSPESRTDERSQTELFWDASNLDERQIGFSPDQRELEE